MWARHKPAEQAQDSGILSPQALTARVLPSSTPRSGCDLPFIQCFSTPRTGCQVERGIARALGLEPTRARMGQEVGRGVS